jgi:hypothetical protein
MVFGGRKFNKWREQNPDGIYTAFKEAQGDSQELERILKEKTSFQCNKQIKHFVRLSKKIGILIE